MRQILLFSMCSLFLLACGPGGGGVVAEQTYPLASPSAAPLPYDGVQPFSGHRSQVEAMTFGKGGDILFSAADGEPVIGWNPYQGRPIRKYSGDIGEVVGLVAAPDGEYVALANPDKILLWDTTSGAAPERLIRLPQTDKPGENAATITAVSLASNAEFLLVGDSVGRLIIIRADNGEAETIFRTGLEPIVSIGNGNTWASVTDGKSTYIVDLREEPVPLPLRGKIEGLSVRSGMGYDKALVGSDGTNIIIWGPDFQDAPRAIKGNGIASISVDPVSGAAAVVQPNGDLLLWDVEKKRQKDVKFAEPGKAHVVALEGTAGRKDGLLVATVEEGQIVVRNTRTGKVQCRMYNAIVPTFLRFEPGSHKFLVGGSDGRPTNFDLDNPGELKPFTGMGTPIVEGILDLEANGYYVTTADGTIVVFDYAKGKVAREVAVTVGERPHIALNKSQLAVVSERRGLTGDTDNDTGELVVFDLIKGEVLSSLNVTDAVDVEFAPAGPTIFYAGRSGFIETWNYENNQRKKQFDEINTTAERLRLAPGGTLLALCGDAGVTFYNPSLKVLSAVKIPNVIDVSFAFDGTRAVAATADHKVYVILFHDDRIEVQPLVEMPTGITSMAISSDNKYLLVGEARGTISAFDLSAPGPTPNATLQVINEGRWVIYTPDGIWAGDPPDDLHFEVKGQVSKTPGESRKWLRDRPGLIKAL